MSAGASHRRPRLRAAAFALAAAQLLIAHVLFAQAAEPVQGSRDDREKKPVAGNAKASVTPAAAQTIDADVVADPAGAWRRFLDEATFSPTQAAYGVLTELSYTHESVDAEACVRHREALAASVRAVPVSIALRRAAMLCAEAQDDDAAAERELAALAALSKHALVEHGDRALQRPIRVVQLWDMYALLRSLGYEFRYEYFNQLRPKRYFPHVIAAWDPNKNVERHFSFDYIDTVATIDRDDPYAGYPYHRIRLAEAYVEALLGDGDPLAQDFDAVRDATIADDPRERARLLRAGAERGGILSSITWFSLCDAEAFEGCADGFVDAVLPQAEQGHALAMTLLAMAYRKGVGLKKDVAASEKMLANANSRWYQHGASTKYIGLMIQSDNNRLPDGTNRMIDDAIAAGSRDAEFMRSVFKLMHVKERPLDAADIAVLESAEHNRIGMGFAMLADHYETLGRTELRWEAMRKAAKTGHASSQYRYAQHLLEQRGDAEKEKQAQQLLVEAAQGGDISAMRALSEQSVDRGDWVAATSWLLAAVDANHVDAMLDWGRIAESGPHPGLEAKPEDAYALYGRLSELGNVAEARRAMARMSRTGNGTPKDLAKAKALLLADAEKGDAESQEILAIALLNGELGAPDIAEGEAWIKKAVASGSSSAKGYYGFWLLKKSRDAASRARGRVLLRELEAANDVDARNDLAWLQCVSPHADVRDPVAGLILAKRLEPELDELDAGTIDTVAACYAANGDFARAVALQKRAIQDWPKDEDGQLQGDTGMPERLALYEAGKAFIETVPPKNDD